MKAAVLHRYDPELRNKEFLVYEEIDDPPAPGPGLIHTPHTTARGAWELGPWRWRPRRCTGRGAAAGRRRRVAGISVGLFSPFTCRFSLYVPCKQYKLLKLIRTVYLHKVR